MASEKILTVRSRILFSLAAFAAALALRLVNAPLVFAHGVPQIAPVDELYHLKRMAVSAAHFPRVLELDRDRGIGGAFCPWPPLYDLTAGGIARLTGATSQDDVLRRVIWIPPIAFALFVALTTVWIDRRFGRRAAIVAAIALAASPFIAGQSSLGDIDHHWLEPIFVVAIVAAADARRRFALAVALTAALFVQTALLIAAALAFAILFFTDAACGAIAFGIGAFAIALYRATRAAGYPDNQWFLGWTHAALFAAAAVACAYVALRGRTTRDRLFALLAGAAVVFATPSAPSSLLGGTTFFGGEPWLRTISEFQPLWRARPDDLLSIATGLGTGVVLVFFLGARAIRERDRLRITLALFAVVYLLLTISSRRFWSVSIPLLAIAGAVEAASIRRRWTAIAAMLAVALVPPLQFALWQLRPTPPVSGAQQQWIDAARFLQSQPPGRVLAPWWYGHVIDVAGHRATVIDNFGTMPDETTFDRAQDAFLTTREDSLARYCRDNGIRYVMLVHPIAGLASATATLGLDETPYVRGHALTKLGRATWWARASSGAPLQHFRRIAPFVWEANDAR